VEGFILAHDFRSFYACGQAETWQKGSAANPRQKAETGGARAEMPFRGSRDSLSTHPQLLMVPLYYESLEGLCHP
jgi:hypothetical protein